MKKRFFFTFLLFLYSMDSPAAEPREETLKPVVVTATRVETPQEQVTTSITVITAEEIRAHQAETVLEVLRNVPGLDVVQSGSRGATTSVFIRGSESNQVLVLIDGVEINSTTTGALNFAHLTTENIERIEILRGAGGTLFGSQAFGVVHIITQRGEGLPRLSFSAEGGSGRTHRQVLGLRGGAGKWGYSLSAARLETQGFHRFNDDYRNLSTSARVDYRLMKEATLKGIFRFVKTDQGLFNSNNFVPAPDPDAREALSRYVGKLEWQHWIVPEWDYRLSGSIFKEYDEFTDDPDVFSFDTRDRSRFRPRIATGEFQTNYRFGQWSITTFGTEFKQRRASTFSSSDGTDQGGIHRSVQNMAYYLQEQIQLLDHGLILIPGVRLDDHEKFGTEWSPAFSAAYLFKESRTRLRTGYAEGFRAPNLNELFFPPGSGCPAFGNPNLGPEKSWELNAGVDQELFGDRAKTGVTYFHREVTDLIEARPIPGAPPFCSRAENVGVARFDGVEWSMQIKILSPLTLGTTYTYMEWNTQNGRLIRRPRQRGSVNLHYLYEGFRVNLDANIVGQRDDRKATSFATLITKPGYVKLDLAASYSLPLSLPVIKGVDLFGKIENLFNKRYEEADGFRARPINFILGLRGTFGID